MPLTKKKAIANHRKQWDWHTNHPEKEKPDYPEWKRNGGKIPACINDCFLCEYHDTHEFGYCGETCLLVWPGVPYCLDSIFRDWCEEKNLSKRAKLAAQIRDLPERRF